MDLVPLLVTLIFNTKQPYLQLKKEQERRTELAEREGILRTKAMREKEEQKSRRKYRYCLIRWNSNFPRKS